MQGKATAGSVDEYIASRPPEIRAKLERLREAILAAAPEAEQRISYGMPGFFQDGPLAYFAVFERHIGFYPLPSAMETFAERLAPYKKAKGSVQFPIGEDPPYGLVRDMVAFRLKENREKAASKAKGSKGRA